ncbi:pyridine nucleotide-disulfide oxidoreductase, partial [Streptomyces sp. SID6648]|nr:pyridine nucleotide-disulfide oxidoreductase [Streptomyces sp. SID6648]
LLSDDPELLFTRYSPRYFPPADDLVRYLADFADRTGVRVRYDTAVRHVTRDAEGFTVTDQDGTRWRARRLV